MEKRACLPLVVKVKDVVESAQLPLQTEILSTQPHHMLTSAVTGHRRSKRT